MKVWGPTPLGGQLRQELVALVLLLRAMSASSSTPKPLGVPGDQVELLGLALALELLHLQAFVDQGADGLALDVREILFRGLNAGSDDQKAHARWMTS